MLPFENPANAEAAPASIPRPPGRTCRTYAELVDAIAVRVIERLKFEAGPEIIGWVNYHNKVCPLFKDPSGGLFLNEDGWASTRRYPLTRSDDDYGNRVPGAEFRF